MSNRDQHWQKSRGIIARIVVEGELELLTPAHFGGGEAGETADMELLRDARDGLALLPGPSITGALRNYWREFTSGYGARDEDNWLFGAHRMREREPQGSQSLLIIDDALGDEPQIELRDGVRIKGATRTADEGGLFDIEVLRASTRFPLRFELLIPERLNQRLCGAEASEALRRDLALALRGFETQEITLGARKNRGYGRCIVRQWRVRRYDLTQRQGLLAWLAEGRVADAGWEAAPTVPETADASATKLLKVSLEGFSDHRDRFELCATFTPQGSLLIRSGSGKADQGPDAEHLHRVLWQAEGQVETREPILSGTSLAGALRARATRIANTLTVDRVRANRLVDGLFGVGPEDKDKGSHQASRLVIDEASLGEMHTLHQSRIRIDRFTGGVLDNYLFTEAPVFAGHGAQFELRLTLRRPNEAQIGLLLLLLKDLWTGDLPLGGESSIGRGRLTGLGATLRLTQAGQTSTWQITQGRGQLQLTADPEQSDVWNSLERYVTALHDLLVGR